MNFMASDNWNTHLVMPPPPRLSRIDAFQEGDGPLRTSCVDELYTRLNFNRFYDQRAISPLW